MYYHDLETEDRPARQARKWKAVRVLMDKAWNFSGEFRARMESAGLKVKDIDSAEAFAEIPVLRKKDIIALQAERGLEWLLACDIGKLKRIYMSPGPIFDPESSTPDHWGWAEAFFAAGFRPEDLVQVTFGYHLTPAGLMMEEPLREIGCAVIPAGPGNTAVQVELMRRLPVTGFVGMASYLRTIGEKAVEAGLDPRQDFKLRCAFVAAEKLTESLRGDVQDMFGITVRQGYGTADAGAIAYECDQLGGMHVSSRCFVEICDPATGKPVAAGQVGEVVVTPFVEDYPLIRLATGDLSFLVDGACACGRTSSRLGGIVGRADDTAKVKGQFIYPAQAAKVMAAFPQIMRWQLVVENPGGRDSLTACLCLAGELDDKAFAAAFQAEMKLKPGVRKVADAELAEDAPRLVDRRKFES